MKFALFALLSISVLLLGCVVQEETPMPTPSVVSTPAEQPTTTPTSVPTATATAVPTQVPTEVPTPTPAASPSPTAQAPAATITIQNFAFNPPTLNIVAGTTVTWVNNDDAEHILASVQSAPSSFFSAPLRKSDTFSVTFNHTGTYGYHCTIHPAMMGNVLVS